MKSLSILTLLLLHRILKRCDALRVVHTAAPGKSREFIIGFIPQLRGQRRQRL